MTLLKMGYKLREAQDDDVKLLFEWVNDPLVRKNSFNEGIISWEEHLSWFIKKLSQKELTRIFIFENEENEPIGQIRFDKKKTVASIDFSLDKTVRQKGISAALLEQGCKKIKFIWHDLEQLNASVKPQNSVSQRTFLRCGFKESVNGTHHQFVKDL